MALLLLPAFLLAGCLADADPPGPAPKQTDPSVGDTADSAHADGFGESVAPTCNQVVLFTYSQSGIWTDRQGTDTFEVPNGTEGLIVSMRASLQATAEFRATLTGPQGDTWYDAYMVGYQIDDHEVNTWGGYREGQWGDVHHKEPAAGEHIFALQHIGPIDDLEYVVRGELCAPAE